MQRWFSQFLPSVVEELDEAALDRVMQEDFKRAWVIDFWAPWCGHCIQFAPAFDQAARELDGQVKFGKVNCVDHAAACQKAAVQAYPTVKFYSQGRRTAASGVRLQAHDSASLVDLVHRVMGQFGWQYQYRDEL